MKTETFETTRTVTETTTFYVADDGTKFKSADRCKEYEESIEFALKLRIKSCLKKLDRSKMRTLDCIMDDGRDESNYYFLKFKTDSDITNFIAWIRTGHDLYTMGKKGWWENHKDEYFYIDFESLKTDTEYILVMNYDDDYPRVYDLEHFKEMYTKLFTAALDAVETSE